MNKDIVISANALTKVYKLYKKPIDRLKEALHPLKKSYHNDFYALNDVSFDIKKGETVGIIGRNGSGKSTLLKIITGVLTPTKGSVKVYGNISAILELGAGFNPEMNGIENIYLNTAINKIDKKNIKTKIEEIISFSELDDFIKQPLKTYSSGMKARLGFALAINSNPDILIVDEVLAVGDAAFQRKCYAKMEEIRKNGTTILFVSHNEGNIVNLCNRAIWLSNGEKIIEGTPKLVTGIYLKNSNKKTIDKHIVINEYKELLKKETKTKKQTVSVVSKKFYDEKMLPKSTINYSQNGAFISNTHIEDINGNIVNILEQGKKYIYVYDVAYEKDFSNIRLGMVIKTTKGIILVAGQYPYFKTKNGISVKKNIKYQIKWSFVCSLGEGIYFTNSGTYDIKTGVQLHRILDACMFKVVSNEKNINAGLVNLIENGEFNAI